MLSALSSHARAARERELQERGHVEERERLTLRGDGQDPGAGIDVEPLGSPFFGIVPAPLEQRVIHDFRRGDRMAHAAPLVGVPRVDEEIGRSGVGHEEMAAVGAEAQAVRIGDAAQDAGRLGARAQGGRILVQQHVVGGVVADRDPPPIRTHADAIRDVEAALQQDLAVFERATRVAIQPMPGHRIAVVVADQYLAGTVLSRG